MQCRKAERSWESVKIGTFKAYTLTPPQCTCYILYDNAHFLCRYYLGHSTA